jgi:hypothetical protein
MIESIKITSLNNIGANLSYNSVFPVVDINGTPVTDKANLQIIGNYILSQAGSANMVQAAQAGLAQSVVNAAQPNITSTGTLTSLTVSGNTNLGNLNVSVGNLKVSGGNNGYVLQTDGAGNLSWTAQTGGGGNGVPGGSNTQVQFNNAGSFGGEGNFTYDSSNHILSVTRANTSFLTAYESVSTANLSSNGIATIARLNVTNTANLGAPANIKITGGSNGQVLTTDGTGNLSWTAKGGGGNANTGNIGFNNTTIYSTNTNNVYIQAATSTWTLGSDGNTTFPNGGRVTFGEQNGNSFIQAGMGFHISSQEGISLDAVDITDPENPITNTWYFSPNGSLALPNNGVLDFNAPYSRFKDNSTGVQLGSPNDQNYVNVDNSAITIQVNSDSLANSIQKNWIFDTTGNLILPSGGIVSDSSNIGIGLTAANPPVTIVITGADFVTVNNTYTRDLGQATPTWTPAGYNPSTDPYILFDNTGWGIFVPGFNQSLYINTGTITAPLAQWNTHPPLGSVAPTGAYTFNNPTWSFDTAGSIKFPNQPTNQRTGYGEALLFAKTGTQKIIGTKAGTANIPVVERLVVAGGDGFDTGEGGDIYLWAGRSGANGGTGGDIKVDGGDGYNGSEGGTIKIRGGYSQGGTAGPATGGFIEIYAGGGNIGAPVDIRSGQGNSQANSGNVAISTPYGGTWTFDNFGTLYAPGNVTINGTNILVGQGANTLGLANSTLVISSTSSAYIQAVINNVSDNGSADWVAQGHHGNDNGGWVDMGFASSFYGDPAYTITGPGTGYVIAQGYLPGQAPAVGTGSLVLGTGENGTEKDIIFGTGGFLIANTFGRISDANNALELTRAGASIVLPNGGVIEETSIPFGGLSGNTIALTPAGGINPNQQLLVYPTAGQDFNHLHLTSGNLYNTELYLGDDNLYVKLANTGNIIINSNDGIGNSAQWNFGTNGAILTSDALALRVPDGIPNAVTGIVTSSGSWESNPTVNLGTTGGTGTGLTVDVTESGGYASVIAVHTPGTGYSNGDTITVVSGSSYAVFTISVTINQWTFGTDGTLDLPDGSTIINGFITGTANSAGGVSSGGNGYQQFFAQSDGAYVQTSVNDAGITFNSWVFGLDGTLNLPQSSSAGNSIIQTTNNIQLNSNNKVWTFSTGGNLTVPGSINGATQVSANSILVSSNANITGNLILSSTTQIVSAPGSNGNITLDPDGTGVVNVIGNVVANNFSGNISITGNVQGTNPNVTLVAGSYSYKFDNTGVLTLPAQGIGPSNEGAEIDFTKAPNSSLSGNAVIVDQYIDRLRFFEGGGTSRGAYIDLSQAAAGVGTLLNNRVSGIVNAGTFVTMDNLKATVTTSGQRGLSLAAVSGSFNIMIGSSYSLTASTGGNSGTGTINTTPSSSQFNYNFTSQGDMSVYIITDTTNNRAYRITLQIGASYNNNLITIERLV